MSLTDQAQQLAQALPFPFQKDFVTLVRQLEAYQGRWGLFILQYQNAAHIAEIGDRLNLLFPGSATLAAHDQQHAAWIDLERALVVSSQAASMVQIHGLEWWLDAYQPSSRTRQRLRAWNFRRDAFASQINCPILCWMTPAQTAQLSAEAPDLWSWRAGVFRFLSDTSSTEEWSAPMNQRGMQDPLGQIDNRSRSQRESRVAELTAALSQKGADLSDELKAALMLELAAIRSSLGHLDEALHILRNMLLPHVDPADASGRANLMGRIADLLLEKGDIDAALRIKRDEQLPVYERLSDRSAIADTLRHISRMLNMKGSFQDGLHMLRHEVLPLYVQLGDTYGIASTLGDLAMDLAESGDLEAGARLILDEQIPVYEKLRDRTGRAFALSNHAHLLSLQGHHEEALRVFQQEVLPEMERAGHLRGKAMAWVRTSQVLRRMGRLRDSAALIRNDALPLLERIGDVIGVAVCKTHLAADLARLGLDEDRSEIKRLLEDADRTATATGIALTKPIRSLYRSTFGTDLPAPGSSPDRT